MILQLTLAALFLMAPEPARSGIIGGWETTNSDGTKGAAIFTDKYFSIAWYEKDKFVSTKGGSWSQGDDGSLKLKFEFHTAEPELIGTEQTFSAAISGETLTAGETSWKRVDDGTPGALEGAWLMTGARREGEIRTRTPGARRTMKILSGTRFQWIAYNVETKQFSGTGGGTYTTRDGRYIENIEFFSRDDSRSGLSLDFRYSLVDGVWHHDGNNSRGEPMYEVWSTRESVGI